MSTTLAVLLKRLDPSFDIKMFEMMDKVSEESTSAMNNAGTGHAGFCELNYTPQKEDNSVDIKKAIKTASEFMISREFWADLVKSNYIKDPKTFIRKTAHYSFVDNEKDIAFLKVRHEKMKQHPLFNKMEYTEDHVKISEWLPLVMKGRDPQAKIACTRVDWGTDVDFGNLTKEVLLSLVNKKEIDLQCNSMVKSFRRKGSAWTIQVQNTVTKEKQIVEADFVFIGAGGGSILLLEKTGIPEANIYGGFPVGGEWLVCENPEIVKHHEAKVYGQAQVGAPPMSVPHLDTRIINGESKLLFGPFAVFSTKFLKNGSHLDFFRSLQLENMAFITQAGFKNMDLTRYLLSQVSLSKKDKIKELQRYFPEASGDDWTEVIAGQRVQVIKKDKELGGVLEFGTETVTSSDFSLAAMLGASPGASTSVEIIVSVLRKCFSQEFESTAWQEKLNQFIPSLNKDLSNSVVVEESKKSTTEILQLN